MVAGRCHSSEIDRGSKLVSNARYVGAAELLAKAIVVPNTNFLALSLNPIQILYTKLGFDSPAVAFEGVLSMSTLSLKTRTMGVAWAVAVK